MLATVRQLFHEFRHMPAASIDLMYGQTARHSHFFQQMVWEHYRQARRRRLRYLFIRRLEYGIALCPLPATFAEYFMRIDGSARRNCKKAIREGCSFQPIGFNDHLDAIREIRLSSKIRQGRQIPADFLKGIVEPCHDPPPESALFAYSYFGVFQHGKLVAYAGCMIAGEVCCLEQIWGHAQYLAAGIVPLLITSIAQHLYDHHLQVRFYAYGTYFGAGETMRRFKRKLAFDPHRVTWVLDKRASHDGPVERACQELLQ